MPRVLQRLQTVIKNAKFQLQVSRSGRNALAVLYWRTVRRASGPVPGGHAALRLHSSLYRKRLEVFIAPAAPAEERGACNTPKITQMPFKRTGTNLANGQGVQAVKYLFQVFYLTFP